MIIIRILRFFAIAALIYFLIRLIWKGNPLGIFKREKKPGHAPPLEQMKKDPICGTYIPESQALTLNWKKETHYFCSKECKAQFEKQNQN